MNSNKIREIFEEVIKNDINLVKKQAIKETGSFSEILPIISSQSFLIKLGNTIEKCFQLYVKEINGETINSVINGSQADLYFIKNNVKYYFEIKNNVNLDTEKSIAVVKKITDMWKYADISACLSFRKATNEEFSKFSKPILQPYIYGYNDFFDIFGDYLSETDFDEIIEEILAVFEGS
jgi:hypothetical protein